VYEVYSLVSFCEKLADSCDYGESVMYTVCPRVQCNYW
jgi:hypothetical protein